MSESQQKRSLIDVITCNGKADPLFLFEEYTFIEEDWKKEFFDYCLKWGYIALIEQEADTKQWIFHSISHGASNRIWKKPIADNFEKLDKLKYLTEKRYEELFVTYLRNQGIGVQPGYAQIGTCCKVMLRRCLKTLDLTLFRYRIEGILSCEDIPEKGHLWASLRD
ncbi:MULTISPECIES: hypothetical protein [Nostoc]|uniref:Uncharacterized protein n=1 Tax=Nostoc paludosum FACHB-159 TaxID=2692908 RepID=A0ABR8KIW8_9NOSO|nr:MULTISPECIES: hypothetical protein [Nostoc]MBD2681537.1 hypothetical protein [Nostoc sp. FACHB-857]MBD2737997.1 hypothetical protein [Nostoc paludosum FACHB-159]